MNHASHDMPSSIFFHGVVLATTGINRANSEGPPSPSSSPPTIQRIRINANMPKVTYSGYVILPIFLVSSFIAFKPGVRSLVFIFLPNTPSM